MLSLNTHGFNLKKRKEKLWTRNDALSQNIISRKLFSVYLHSKLKCRDRMLVNFFHNRYGVFFWRERMGTFLLYIWYFRYEEVIFLAHIRESTNLDREIDGTCVIPKRSQE